MKEILITALKVMILGAIGMAGLVLFCVTLTLIPQSLGRVMGYDPFDPMLLILLVPGGLFASSVLFVITGKLSSGWCDEWMGYDR